MSQPHLEFQSLLQNTLPQVCRIAYQAGQIISEFYHQEDTVAIEQKSDGSPVTEADHAADAFIREQLALLTSSWPMVTEESVAEVCFEERQQWSTYWLVDPLDGTKEFIHGSGEFSINIALVHNQRPILGVVYGPEKGQLYFAVQEHPNMHFPQQHAGKMDVTTFAQPSRLDRSLCVHNAQPLKVAASPAKRIASQQAMRVAVSRRHGGVLDDFMQALGVCETVHMGSALKACLVADGLADIYPRFGPTSLWDTAASQCVLECAGGALIDRDGQPLKYVQTESLLNPFFMAVSDGHFAWPNFPEESR